MIHKVEQFNFKGFTLKLDEENHEWYIDLDCYKIAFKNLGEAQVAVVKMLETATENGGRIQVKR